MEVHCIPLPFPCSTQIRDMCRSQKFCEEDQVSEWMAKLAENRAFVCTFPNPASAGAQNDRFAGFECVVKNINDASERIDVESLKGVSLFGAGFR